MIRFAALLLPLLAACTAGGQTLDNGLIRADFGRRGLLRLADRATGRAVEFAGDGFSVQIGAETLTGGEQAPARTNARTVEYRADDGGRTVRAVYELQPGWRFIRKRLMVDAGDTTVKIRRIELLSGALAAPPTQTQRIRGGLLLRWGGAVGLTHGLFVMVQNPFGKFRSEGAALAAEYAPEAAWAPGGPPHASDGLLLGLTALPGPAYPATLAPEWKAAEAPGPVIYNAEVEAILAAVRAHLLPRTERAPRLHVGWCDNDYQIDIATPEGRTTYRRIIDQAAAVGCREILFGPANSAVSSQAECRDAWGWENLLWLTMGQKLRKGEWDPAKDALDRSVAELRDYARQRGVRLVAYVYPSLPFMQNPAWTRWVPNGQPGGYLGADTGQRSFQEWLVGRLVAFAGATGAGGFSFDHWWIAYDETTSSKWEQWDGCRRILEGLRRKLPDAVIDGRQQYHGFGVWTWLAGSYPHPLCSDEQPESFRSFPDLHWSRASADRQRRTAWFYRNECFAPAEIMPGYMTHQTPRLTSDGQCPRTPFRAADWDLLGWKYSVISALATAPMNHVVNFLPARDEREFAAFPAADQRWLRGWLDWTDSHRDILREGRPIAALGQPRLGGVDGWSACRGDRGYLFLFNPNYRRIRVRLPLDSALGIGRGARFQLRTLFPDVDRGALLVPPTGPTWRAGNTLEMEMPGAEALVLELCQAGPVGGEPLVLGAVGSASVRGGTLAVTEVAGEPGTPATLAVALPGGSVQVRRVTVNGAEAAFQIADGLVRVTVTFDGARCGQRQALHAYDPACVGGAVRSRFVVPARVWKELADRKRSWPVDYTSAEREAAWLNSDRLILYVQIAEPDDTRMKPTLRIDGRDVTLQPCYSSIVRSNPTNSFVGWRADITDMKPDMEHEAELELPALAPGQYQGMFLDTVERGRTTEVAPGPSTR